MLCAETSRNQPGVVHVPHRRLPERDLLVELEGAARLDPLLHVGMRTVDRRAPIIHPDEENVPV